MKKPTIFLIIFTLSLAVMRFSDVQAQSNVYKLHALFMYNFVKHMQWEGNNTDFTIGVYGSRDVFNTIKENFDNKHMNGKSIRVIEVNTVEQTTACQILYLPASSRNKSISMISQVDHKNVLIVTEEVLITEGASISFELVGAKLNFIINKPKIDQAGIKISSSLLALGTVVS
jgi:hypothetical protein